MKILLTGSNGFLGSCFYEILSKKHQVYTLSRANSDYNCNLEIEIPTLINHFDLIIHSAGKAHTIPKNEIQISQFYKVNVLGTINLLEGLKKHKLPKYFVFISSVSVYGLIEGENISETTPLLAKDPYGKSKIEAESIIQKWCENHNVICTILRLPLVVGKNPPGNLGVMIRGIKNNFYFNIAGGNAQKSMVLSIDIVNFVIIAAEVGGLYNLTDGIHPTFKDLSKRISMSLGKSFVPNMPLFLAVLLAKIGDFIGDTFPINSSKLSKIISTLTFDDSKARTTFGWKPTAVLEGLNL